MANTTGLLDVTESGCTAISLVISSNTTIDGTYYTKHTITGTSQFGGVLINSDASNTSTSFSDSSISGHTITAGGQIIELMLVLLIVFQRLHQRLLSILMGQVIIFNFVNHDLKLQNDFTIETFVFTFKLLVDLYSKLEQVRTYRTICSSKETTGSVTLP